MKKILSRGAEAIIYESDCITKERIRKTYRIKEIDEKLRGFRTRREVKVLLRLESINFPSPRLLEHDDTTIKMEYIKGVILKDILEEKNYIEIAREIGKKIGILHSNNIIHGDLTTSNMILSDEVYFIDFGLSFFSTKIEDMAVDLHLLREALESKHYKIWKECFEDVLDYYKNEKQESNYVLKRLEIVEKRGRYKQRY